VLRNGRKEVCLASEPVTFQVWRWNKITDFIPKLLDFEIGVNLTVDFIPND
jgi:hypothetical protein